MNFSHMSLSIFHLFLSGLKKFTHSVTSRSSSFFMKQNIVQTPYAISFDQIARSSTNDSFLPHVINWCSLGNTMKRQRLFFIKNVAFFFFLIPPSLSTSLQRRRGSRQGIGSGTGKERERTMEEEKKPECFPWVLYLSAVMSMYIMRSLSSWVEKQRRVDLLMEPAGGSGPCSCSTCL